MSVILFDLNVVCRQILMHVETKRIIFRKSSLTETIKSLSLLETIVRSSDRSDPFVIDASNEEWIKMSKIEYVEI